MKLPRSGRKWETSCSLEPFITTSIIRVAWLYLVNFAKQLAKNAKVYIIEGFEGCLSIYPELHFQTLVAELQKLQYTNKK